MTTEELFTRCDNCNDIHPADSYRWLREGKDDCGKWTGNVDEDKPVCNHCATKVLSNAEVTCWR